MNKLMIFLALIFTIPCIFGQAEEYKTMDLTDNTLEMQLNKPTIYYIYPTNPANIPLELEIEFTNGQQLIKNIDELQDISLPPNTLVYEHPVAVELQLPKEPFKGDTFVIEYIIYDKSENKRIQFGPRNMFYARFMSGNYTRTLEWDVVALRMSFLTLLITIMVITTVIIANRYFFDKNKEGNNK
jgi:hypothetical protein